MERTLALEALHKIGEQVTLQGWVDTIRDHGKVVFVDLRDRSGLIQAVILEKTLELHPEDVVEIQGRVQKRPENLVNPDLETGSIEVAAESVVVLNHTKTLPFPIDSQGTDINEDIRLRYRYVDLRRPRLNHNFRLRSQLAYDFRQAFHQQDFVEIETPLLTKSTKEGSRDFLVPSRLQPGKFYALPQSPQQYKQLLMTAGFENYFQFARCIRDEDLRADRGFEHTQIDIEMSFVERDQVMARVEAIVKEAMQANGAKLQQDPFPVFTYQQAIDQYGEDKFDLRTEAEKEAGILAFAWVVDFPFFKEVDKGDAAEVMDGKSGWTFTHNPFSQPKPEFLDQHLAGKDIDQIVTTQYDLVCNGYEVGGGSIRAHQPEVLRQTFQIMGYSETEIEASVGHMLQAFELGTPPHGGIALGFDRLVMLLAGEKSLKETIAFPMSSTGRTAVMDAPTSVAPEQLAELGIHTTSVDKTLDITEQIRQKLENLRINFEVLNHPPVVTSQEAAQIRQSSLAAGAKALVMQADQELIMVVVPGDKKVNLAAIKKSLNIKDVSMASKEIVETKTQVQIGGVPPLGSLFGMTTYVDTALAKNEVIYFNAGRRDISIKISYQDYLRVEQPQLGEFAV